MTMQDGRAFGRPFWPGIAFGLTGGVQTPAQAQAAYNTQLAPYRHKWLNPAEGTKYYCYCHGWPWSEFYVDDTQEPASPTDNNDPNYKWDELHALIDWCESNSLKLWINLDTENSYPLPDFIDSILGTGDRPVGAWHRSEPVRQMKDFLTALHKEYQNTALAVWMFEEDNVGGSTSLPSDFSDSAYQLGRADYVRHCYNTCTTWTTMISQSGLVQNHLADIPVGPHIDDPKLGFSGCGSSNTPFPVYDCGLTGYHGYMQSRNGTLESPPGGVPRAVMSGTASNGWKVVDPPHSAHSPWGTALPIAGEETTQSCGGTGGDYPRNISPAVFIWYMSGEPRAPAPLNDSGLGQSGPDNAGVTPCHLIAMQCGTPDAWDEAFSLFGWNEGTGTNAFPALPYDWLEGTQPPQFQLRNDQLAPQDKVTGELRAFPSAQGFGKYVTGGRGGPVRLVTNTSTSGNGSLQGEMDKGGPQIIVITVGGEIGDAIDVPANTTIIGQTAPGQGICVLGKNNFVVGDNVIIRGVKFYIGEDGNGLWLTGGVKNVIIDHCAIAWWSNEGFSTWISQASKSRNVTLSNTILFDGMGGTTDCGLPGGTPPNHWEAHALQITPCDNFTAFRNALINTDGRSPKFAGECNKVEYVNNLSMQQGQAGFKVEPKNSGGPGVPDPTAPTLIHSSQNEFLQDWAVNVIDDNVGYPPGSRIWLDDLIGINYSKPLSDTLVRSSGPVFTSLIDSTAILPRNQLAASILPDVGPLQRDPYINGAIADYIARNRHSQCPPDVPNFNLASDTYPDHTDGLPDEWAALHNAGAAADIAPDGYAWIERYANSLFGEEFSGGETFSINTSVLLANDTGAGLTVTSVQDGVHCSVSLSGSTITIAIEPNFEGTASFSYTATDGNNSATATASFTVGEVPADTIPSAVDDTLTSVQRNAAPFQVSANQLLANDSGSALLVSAVSDPAGCTVSLDVCAQTLTIAPLTGFVGTATFLYTIASNEPDWSDTALVSFAVTDQQGTIAAAPDVVSAMNKNATAFNQVSAAFLLANDTGSNLQITSATAFLGCQVVLNQSAQTIDYRPLQGFSGTAQFGYVIEDGNSAAQSTVTFEVINRAPVCATVAPQTVNLGSTLELQLTGTDPDGDPLSFSLETGPGVDEGTVTLNSQGAFRLDTASMSAPKLITSISVACSDDDNEKSNVVPLTIDVQAVDPNHKLITFDDLDATLSGSGWQLLSNVGGSAGFVNAESEDWFINTTQGPSDTHTAVIPSSVSVGATLLFVVTCDSQRSPRITLTDETGWVHRVSVRRYGSNTSFFDRVVTASDIGRAITAQKVGFPGLSWVSAFIVLPEGSQHDSNVREAEISTQIEVPPLTPINDGCILFAMGARLGLNDTQHTHAPAGMTSMFDRWSGSGGNCQMAMGYLVQEEATLFAGTVIPVDEEAEWGAVVIAYTLGAGGSTSLPYTNAYQGDAYYHEASAGGEYLSYIASSSKVKNNLTVKVAWPSVPSLELQGFYTLIVGTTAYGPFILNQQSVQGGLLQTVFAAPLAPAGDIELRIGVTSNAPVVADRVVFEYVEGEGDSFTFIRQVAANAVIQQQKTKTIRANGYIVEEGGEITEGFLYVTANAILDSSEGPAWTTVYEDDDIWVQKKDD